MVKRSWIRWMLVGGLACLAGMATERRVAAAADVVMYATDAATVRGNWTRVSDSTAAGGQRMASSDNGWSTTDGPLSNPADYFEVSFTASANTAYHVWLRLRAGSNSKYNDSLYVQFSDSQDSNGSAIYRSGTTSGLTLNLQSCNGCSLSGWGWLDGAYWLSQSTTVRFANSGTHTIRVQTREDGVSVDQIVLSPSTYLSGAPGQSANDNTIISKTSAPSGGGGSGAYSGTPVSLPGTVQAANYDLGGEGVAYHDTSSGNSGGAYRSDNVDIESSSEGGYDVGWISAGEWLNYSVNVSSSGAYTAEIRVASPNGAQLHLGFNGSSAVWSSVNVPATGDWQTWTSVNVPVTLASGAQQMTLMFDTSGLNVRYVKLTAGGSPPPPPSGGPTPYGGSAASIPGTIAAANFDSGGEGVAYHDTTSGNNGGAFRSTDVDLESCSEGGYDVGWAAAGEWLNYTVNVTSSGGYTAQLRVASVNGGTMHIGFNGSSSVWTSVSVPPTGDWQSWTTVNVPVTLGSGQQMMTVSFDSGGVNLKSITMVAGSAPPPPPPPPPPPSGGTSIVVADWNIQVNDDSASHAQTAIDTLMALNPRPSILILEEAHKAQYNTYINRLNSVTGLSWSGIIRTHCPAGAWNGSSCTSSEDEGVAIFTTFPISDTTSALLPFSDCYHSARALAHVSLSVNGTTLHVFGTHLQTGGCSDVQSARYASMSLIKTFASAYGGAWIVGGDFNADPDQIDTTQGMLPNFTDSWSVAGSGTSKTAFSPDWTMKIDYLFTDANGRVQTDWTSVVTGVGVSDHRPIIGSFRVQ